MTFCTDILAVTLTVTQKIEYWMLSILGIFLYVLRNSKYYHDICTEILCITLIMTQLWKFWGFWSIVEHVPLILRKHLTFPYELLCYILSWKSKLYHLSQLKLGTPQWASYYVYENIFICMKVNLYLSVYWINNLFIYFQSYHNIYYWIKEIIYRKRNGINCMDLLKYVNISISSNDLDKI